jgi:hypothetical protein
MLAVTIVSAAAAAIGFALSLVSQTAVRSADDRLGSYVVASVLDFTSIRDTGIDLSTHSVILGNATGAGMLRIRLRIPHGGAWNRLFVTGAEPSLYEADSRIRVSLDGRVVGVIRPLALGSGGGAPFKADPAIGPLITVPAAPEEGYRFPIAIGGCARACTVAIETEGARWQIDRVGVGHFGSSAEPFELSDRGSP